MAFESTPAKTGKAVVSAADDGDPRRWWNGTDANVGRKLTLAAEGIETWNWSQRFMMLTCNRLMTGRSGSAAFGLSMTQRVGRVQQSMASAVFNPPALNVVATAGDVFRNKVYKNRPFLDFLPTFKGDYEMRERCKAQSTYVDALFDELELWPMAELCGQDCMTYPAAFVKVEPDKARKKVKVQRVLAEEILLNGDDGGSYGKPRSMIQRVFIHREDAINEYAKGKDKDKIAAALKNAPGVFAGFYKSPIQYSDILPLVEGWRLPLPDGTPGRHVLAVGSVVLLDEKWERDRFPFAKLVFGQLSNDYMGKPLAEDLLPLQREIDRVSAVIAEEERRHAWNRWLVEKSSKVNPNEFKGPGIINYSGTAPKNIPGEGATKELYAERDSLIEKAFRRARISQGASSGTAPEGVTAGVALLAWNQIDDSAHVAVSQAFEDFIEQIGRLIVEAAAEAKPSVTVNGKQTINWDDVATDAKYYKLRAFPMSRLPTLPAARIQQIQTWYDDGTVDRQTKMRLMDVPDLQGFVDQYTASDNLTHKTIDRILKHKKPLPPCPYSDLKRALEIAQARYQQEETDELDRPRLALIAQYIEAVKEMTPLEPPAPAPMMGAPMPGAATGPMGGGAPEPVPQMAA